MASGPQRRFPLDKVQIDPHEKNRIMSADGDDEFGAWDGGKIYALVAELDRIEERHNPNYAGCRIAKISPKTFALKQKKNLPIWACDSQGNCLVGSQADKIRNVEQIRKRYEKKAAGSTMI